MSGGLTGLNDFLHIFDVAPMPGYYIVQFGPGQGYLRPSQLVPPPQLVTVTAAPVPVTPTPTPTATATVTPTATASATATATPTATAAPTQGTPPPPYHAVVFIPELLWLRNVGDTTQFMVVLAHNVSCDVVVPVTPSGSYPDIEYSPTSLTFTPSNWMYQQGVELTAVAYTGTIPIWRNVTFLVGPCVSQCNDPAFVGSIVSTVPVRKDSPAQPELLECDPTVSALKGGETVTCYGSGLLPDGTLTIQHTAVSLTSVEFGCANDVLSTEPNCTSTFTFVAPLVPYAGYRAVCQRRRHRDAAHGHALLHRQLPHRRLLHRSQQRPVLTVSHGRDLSRRRPCVGRTGLLEHLGKTLAA